MGKQILIAAQDKLLSKLIHDFLADECHSVHIRMVDSVRQAMDEMNHALIDLVITDWQLADTDGLTLIQVAQIFHPNVKAILITDADSDEIYERSRHRRASFISLSKPFSIESLLQYVNQSLNPVTKPVPVPPHSFLWNHHPETVQSFRALGAS